MGATFGTDDLCHLRSPLGRIPQSDSFAVPGVGKAFAAAAKRRSWTVIGTGDKVNPYSPGALAQHLLGM
jgi:hypothetical protein